MLPYRDRKRAMLWLQEALVKTKEEKLLDETLLAYLRDALILEWSNKMDRAIGLAIYNKRKDLAIIRLSPILWVAAPEEQKRETVYHELAHLIVDVLDAHDPVRAKVKQARERRSIHGSSWKRVMTALGYPDPERCHSVVNEAHEMAKGKVPLYCDCSPKALAWVTRMKASYIINRRACKECRAPIRTTPQKAAPPKHPNNLLFRLDQLFGG
jgi:predicted SprT family Zn-dependent metalloprotease